MLIERSNLKLDGFIEFFQTKWLVKKTVFSLSKYKFIEAILDWIQHDFNQIYGEENALESQVTLGARNFTFE
jgi:hypothetical protein